MSNAWNPEAAEYTPQLPPQNQTPATVPQTPGNGPLTLPDQLSVRFPSNNNRQRTSNIDVNNPEIEFLQTSVDSCRSTIVQQETDLKKLRETMDIRNKRILQLEAQVGISVAHISSRKLPEVSNPSIASTDVNNCQDIVALLSKIEHALKSINSPSAPVNNINIHNSSQQCKSRSEHHASSQTDLNFFSCNLCDFVSTNDDDLKHHVKVNHESTNLSCLSCERIFSTAKDLKEHKEIDYTSEQSGEQGTDSPVCDACGKCFPSEIHLLEHLETNHALVYLSCETCNYKCKSETHLNEHIEAIHVGGSKSGDHQSVNQNSTSTAAGSSTSLTSPDSSQSADKSAATAAEASSSPPPATQEIL